MPNRILKDSICTSDEIADLTWFEEVVFYRLMVNCDDFGRFDGRFPVILSRLFPLNRNVTEKSLEAAINRLSTVGLVMPYINDGKPYLKLTTWEKHQQIRAKKSKYPAPESFCNHLISSDSKCPRNPIQSNPNPIQYGGRRGACARDYINALFADVFDIAEPADRDVSEVEYTLKTTSGGREFCPDDEYLLDTAFRAAADAGVKTVAYVKGVFKNFRNRGITTKAQHEAYEYKKSAGSGTKAKTQKPKTEGYEASYNLDEFTRHSKEDPIVYKKRGSIT